MNEYDHCYECLMYGDNYGYDDNGNLISLCADCIDRKEEDDETD